MSPSSAVVRMATSSEPKQSRLPTSDELRVPVEEIDPLALSAAFEVVPEAWKAMGAPVRFASSNATGMLGAIERVKERAGLAPLTRESTIAAQRAIEYVLSQLVEGRRQAWRDVFLSVEPGVIALDTRTGRARVNVLGSAEALWHPWEMHPVWEGGDSATFNTQTASVKGGRTKERDRVLVMRYAERTLLWCERVNSNLSGRLPSIDAAQHIVTHGKRLTVPF